jgi:tryptophan-rich sensory protein
VVVGAGFVVAVVVYAAVSTLLVGINPAWYDSLPKPPWQPPDWVFGAIWPFNFTALLITGIALARADAHRARTVLAVLAVSVVCALAWGYLFYVPHALTASAAALAAAAGLTWVVLFFAYRILRWAGLLLLPYACWVTLATTLAIWYAAEL